MTETNALHQTQNAGIYPKFAQLTLKVLYKPTIHELVQIFLQPVHIIKLLLSLGDNTFITLFALTDILKIFKRVLLVLLKHLSSHH